MSAQILLQRFQQLQPNPNNPPTLQQYISHLEHSESGLTKQLITKIFNNAVLKQINRYGDSSEKCSLENFVNAWIDMKTKLQNLSNHELAKLDMKQKQLDNVLVQKRNLGKTLNDDDKVEKLNILIQELENFVFTSNVEKIRISCYYDKQKCHSEFVEYNRVLMKYDVRFFECFCVLFFRNVQNICKKCFVKFCFFFTISKHKKNEKFKLRPFLQIVSKNHFYILNTGNPNLRRSNPNRLQRHPTNRGHRIRPKQPKQPKQNQNHNGP